MILSRPVANHKFTHAIARPWLFRALLRHANSSTTQRYIRRTDRELAEARGLVE
jgi:hypothetical protein